MDYARYCVPLTSQTNLFIKDGMKRTLFIVMLLWNILGGHDAAAQDWAGKAHYRQANIELLQNGYDPQRVVLMGNSITEYWMEINPQFFADHHLVGRGISGQESYQMLTRFRQDVIALSPRAVIINCGTNDIAENFCPYDEDITMDNIESMTELALHNGIAVILSSVLPCSHFVWNRSVTDVPHKIQSLNARIRRLAEERSLPYIDYYSAMVYNEAGSINPGYSNDGVHPNAKGYAVMEALLLEKLPQ